MYAENPYPFRHWADKDLLSVRTGAWSLLDHPDEYGVNDAEYSRLIGVFAKANAEIARRLPAFQELMT